MNKKQFLEIILDSDENEWEYVDDELGKYIYKKNEKISIIRDADGKFLNYKIDDKMFPWIKNFIQKTGFFMKVNLLYDKKVLETLEVADVDGGRGYIPVPDKRTNKVEKFHYKVAKILNICLLENKFDYYFHRAGFIVE